MATANETLLTAEEFMKLGPDEVPEHCELVDVVPELVAEILSPDDRWPKTLKKVAEYLEAGVEVVCVIDPEQLSIHVFTIDGTNAVLHDTDTLALPTILPGFELPLAKLFG